VPVTGQALRLPLAAISNVRVKETQFRIGIPIRQYEVNAARGLLSHCCDMMSLGSLAIPVHLEISDASPVEARENTADATRHEGTARQRILIVDHERESREILALIEHGFADVECRCAADMRSASTIFAEIQPDLVLLSWQMSGAAGLGLLELWRELLSENEFLPILVFASDWTAESRQGALSAGATDFLTTPFDALEVTARMKHLLRARELFLTQKNGAGTAPFHSIENAVEERTRELSEQLEKLQASQDKVIQQERLSALGTMASGIAHDFNNALTLILGYGELLLQDDHLYSKTQHDDYLRTIITTATDGAHMVARLREFHRSADEPETWQQVDLNELVNQAISLTEPKWKGQAQAEDRTIKVVRDTQPIPLIAGDAAELREMLTNLIFNAVDAMPQGGTIVLSTHSDGSRVALEISDTGNGMSEEVRSRCLEPFFTTKGHLGTGMGLAMVYGIAKRHHAPMTLESELGRGTTFSFSFAAQTRQQGSAKTVVATLAQPLRILIVDDQPLICEILSEGLAQDCHTTEMACDGREALEKFRAGKFDLVITDKAMPEMSGNRLAAAVKESSPETRVILLTGFGEQDHPADGSDAIDLVLGKPVTITDLRHAVARVMSQ
jgi:signal transduction histidine kinase